MKFRYYHIRYSRPRYSKRVYVTLMKTLENILGFDSSEAAKFRFHCLRVFYESGWEGVKLAFPDLSRSTLYRWKKTYETSGKRLNSLVPLSTKPHHLRIPKEHPALVKLVRELREKYPRLGKKKIEPFVKALVRELNLENIPSSSASIGRLIKRKNYFFAGKARTKRTKKSSSKQRVRFCPQASKTQPGYIQLDGVKFHYLERYYYFLTAVDIVSKQAWVKLVPTLSSKHAREFLEEILTTTWFKLHTIHTDNGSEFKAFFEEAVKQVNLIHLWNYSKHPKTTGYVERFNWTVQDEFLFNTEDYLLYPEEFKEKLTEWVSWYNTVRPHQSLGYQSPYQSFVNGGLSQK